MTRRRRFCLVLLLSLPASSWADDRANPLPSPQHVTFASGGLTLGGTIYKPAGGGPFPAMLYNHGSAAGMLNDQAFEQLGPLFVKQGWVFFAPYRRGQGLSASAGPYIVEAISAAQEKAVGRVLPLFIPAVAVLLALLLYATRNRRRWVRGVMIGITALLGVGAFTLISLHMRGREAVRLLETEQLSDHVAALEWLKTQPFVQPEHIATMGNSFGGIITMLAVERPGYCAAIDASGGAQMWSAELRVRLQQAARQAKAPVFLFQAENDYTLSPTHVLSQELQSAGKVHEEKIYPAFGSSAADGHSFAWRGSSIWSRDVFRFLQAHCY